MRCTTVTALAMLNYLHQPGRFIHRILADRRCNGLRRIIEIFNLLQKTFPRPRRQGSLYVLMRSPKGTPPSNPKPATPSPSAHNVPLTTAVNRNQFGGRYLNLLFFVL